MQNPVARTLETLGLTPLKLAVLAGVDSSRVYQLLRGDASRISPRLLGALARLGADPDQLQREYRVWRQQQVADLVAR